MNITQAHNLSKSFLLASQRCLEARPLQNGQIQMLAVPGIVCLAFSIEVGLKALILNEGKSATGHKLDELFNKISKRTQNVIMQEVGGDQSQFSKSLGVASDTFVDWRYMYEQDYTNVDLEFLTKVANAIQKISKETKQ